MDNANECFQTGVFKGENPKFVLNALVNAPDITINNEWFLRESNIQVSVSVFSF